MFYPNCGAEYRDNQIFCESCGNKLIQNQQNKQFLTSDPMISRPINNPTPIMNNFAMASMKGNALAVILSFFIPGIGTIYAGKAGKGIAILFISILFWIFFFFIITLILAFFLWIFGMFDANSTCNRYNFFVHRNQRPPMPGEFW